MALWREPGVATAILTSSPVAACALKPMATGQATLDPIAIQRKYDPASYLPLIDPDIK